MSTNMSNNSDQHDYKQYDHEQYDHEQRDGESYDDYMARLAIIHVSSRSVSLAKPSKHIAETAHIVCTGAKNPDKEKDKLVILEKNKLVILEKNKLVILEKGKPVILEKGKPVILDHGQCNINYEDELALELAMYH